MEKEQKQKKQKKGKKFATVLYGVAITMVLHTGITTGRTATSRKELFNGLDTSYFQKTIFKVPLMLPVKNGVVDLNIDPAFSNEEKQALVNGINELDNLLDGIDYNITFDEGMLKKGINIRAFKENEKTKSTGIACATIKANQWKAEITYPVTIKFDTDMMKEEEYDYDYVIKHELLHTLGLDDLTESQYRDNLMYYGYTTSKPTLNDEQIRALNTVYGPDLTGAEKQNPSVKYADESISEENTEDDILTF